MISRQKQLSETFERNITALLSLLTTEVSLHPVPHLNCSCDAKSSGLTTVPPLLTVPQVNANVSHTQSPISSVEPPISPPPGKTPLISSPVPLLPIPEGKAPAQINGPLASIPIASVNTYFNCNVRAFKFVFNLGAIGSDYNCESNIGVPHIKAIIVCQ